VEKRVDNPSARGQKRGKTFLNRSKALPGARRRGGFVLMAHGWILLIVQDLRLLEMGLEP
jgi:hypothetical protein